MTYLTEMTPFLIKDSTTRKEEMTQKSMPNVR
jgi:hypothetical protein